jgi:hypothetical protein
MEKVPLLDEEMAGLRRDLAAIRLDLDAAGAQIKSFSGKLNEIAAKFNMHSHFLKAKERNQDLFFHADLPGDEGQPVSETPAGLAVKPTRPAPAPGQGAGLRLTPPRHWDDPVIWFDNVSLVEEEKEEQG